MSYIKQLLRHLHTSEVLSYLPKQYKWIAADPTSGMVHAFIDRPIWSDSHDGWYAPSNGGAYYLFAIHADETEVFSIDYLKMAMTTTLLGNDGHFYKVEDGDAMAYRLLPGVKGWQALDVSKVPLAAWSNKTPRTRTLPIGV